MRFFLTYSTKRTYEDRGYFFDLLIVKNEQFLQIGQIFFFLFLAGLRVIFNSLLALFILNLGLFIVEFFFNKKFDFFCSFDRLLNFSLLVFIFGFST